MRRSGWIGAATALLMLASSSAGQAQQAGMSFCVTSNGVGKGADLGGIEGADRHCQQFGAGGRRR